MKSPASAMSGRALRIRSIGAEIVGPAVAPVHRREDAVRSRLHGEVQVGHQRVEVAMRSDQIVVHVVGMAGRVAQPVDAGDLGQPKQQAPEAPFAPVRTLALPGVDVLAEQRHLAHALGRKPRRLGDDRLDRPRHLGAAGIGNDAEGAELVAALLHGQEGRVAAGCVAGGMRPRRQPVEHAELLGDREIRGDDPDTRGLPRPGGPAAAGRIADRRRGRRPAPGA